MKTESKQAIATVEATKEVMKEEFKAKMIESMNAAAMYTNSMGYSPSEVQDNLTGQKLRSTSKAWQDAWVLANQHFANLIKELKHKQDWGEDDACDG